MGTALKPGPPRGLRGPWHDAGGHRWLGISSRGSRGLIPQRPKPFRLPRCGRTRSATSRALRGRAGLTADHPPPDEVDIPDALALCLRRSRARAWSDGWRVVTPAAGERGPVCASRRADRCERCPASPGPFVLMITASAQKMPRRPSSGSGRGFEGHAIAPAFDRPISPAARRRGMTAVVGRCRGRDRWYGAPTSLKQAQDRDLEGGADIVLGAR